MLLCASFSLPSRYIHRRLISRVLMTILSILQLQRLSIAFVGTKSLAELLLCVLQAQLAIRTAGLSDSTSDEEFSMFSICSIEYTFGKTFIKHCSQIESAFHSFRAEKSSRGLSVLAAVHGLKTGKLFCYVPGKTV